LNVVFLLGLFIFSFLTDNLYTGLHSVVFKVYIFFSFGIWIKAKFNVKRNCALWFGSGWIEDLFWLKAFFSYQILFSYLWWWWIKKGKHSKVSKKLDRFLTTISIWKIWMIWNLICFKLKVLANSFRRSFIFSEVYWKNHEIIKRLSMLII
jgi:hypothetical protein